MRRLARSLVVCSLVVCLSATTVQARPSQDGGAPGIGTRIVRLIHQLVRVVLDDPSQPKP